MDLSLKKFIYPPRDRPPTKEIQLRFLKRLDRLLTNGYPLIEALEIIKWDSQLDSIADNVITSLKAGDTFNQALDTARFTSTITSYLYFVQANGDISFNITQCIFMFEQRLHYQKKFQETIRYPLILIVVFALMLYLVQRLVLPSFADIFLLSNDKASSVLLSISIINHLGTLFLLLISILVLLVLAWKLYRHRMDIPTQIRLYCLLPIYYPYKRMQISFLFASYVSSLLKTGMPIKEILSIIASQKKQPILSYYATLMSEELSKGVFITGLLSGLPLLDKQLSVIFQKNADADALEKDLAIYAELTTEEMHRKIAKAIRYIQPVFFVLLAGFIIFIYATLMWPMFELINTI